eukprot:scaffold26681_cov87-Isochrysis_galbana.AAC.1
MGLSTELVCDGQENHAAEFLCPVCCQLVDAPLLTACNHIFCMACLQVPQAGDAPLRAPRARAAAAALPPPPPPLALPALSPTLPPSRDVTVTTTLATRHHASIRSGARHSPVLHRRHGRSPPAGGAPPPAPGPACPPASDSSLRSTP